MARGPDIEAVLSRGLLLWAALVGGLWVSGLLFLPVDPDYTSGELLDHLLSWQATGTLYPELAGPPYRVLNYPPLFLAMARGVTTLGVPALLAGRILGSLGVALALWTLFLWVKDAGTPSSRAVLGLGLAAASFPLLYSAGQVHLEGWAAASTLTGFRLAGRGGRETLLAGLALALGCFFKQTQVVLSLVALVWIWRYRPRKEALGAWAVFAGTGLVGSALITLFFGPEAWRHMLTYTVGTFSAEQLGLQVASFVLPWPVFLWVAFRRAVGDPASRRDLRSWYLVVAALWLLSSARVGSSYAYFLDFHLAVLLWVIPEMTGRREGARWWLLRGQAWGGALVVAGVLAFNLFRGGTLARGLPVLCHAVEPAPALTVSGSPGLVRACGGVPALHPFITASLAGQGRWDPGAFHEDLALGRYGDVLLSFDPAQPPAGALKERWTPEALAIFRDDYASGGGWGDWRILRPIKGTR